MGIQKNGRRALALSSLVVSGFLTITPIVNAAEEHQRLHDHSSMDHSSAAQAGQHVHHSHGKGSWMIEFEFMRMDMDGLLRGKDSVSTRDISGALANPTPPPAALKRPDKPYSNVTHNNDHGYGYARGYMVLRTNGLVCLTSMEFKWKLSPFGLCLTNT